jgi:hypothetical protein
MLVLQVREMTAGMVSVFFFSTLYMYGIQIRMCMYVCMTYSPTKSATALPRRGDQYLPPRGQGGDRAVPVAVHGGQAERQVHG